MDQIEPNLNQNERTKNRGAGASAQSENHHEVIELEVERMDDPAADLPRGPLAHLRGNLLGSLLPIGFGLVLDALDFATRTPRVGLVLGLLCGLFVAERLKLRGKQRIAMVFACAAYCAAPFTTYLPLAGLYAAFHIAQPFLSKAQGKSGP